MCDYVIASGGLTQEWNYPYTAYTGTTGVCSKTIGDIKARLSGYKMIESNNQEAVMDALVTNNAPIVVNVDASAWSNYEGGIYDGCDYAKNVSIDHVVLISGIGEEFIANPNPTPTDPSPGKTVKYFTIRNSWSASFGESGYIRILRHDVPQCGLNVNSQDGVACKGDPSVTHVCGQCGVLYSTGYPIVRV